jgi:probable phosphoglycerate mutase
VTEARRLHLVRHGRVDFSSRAFRASPRGRQWDPPLGDAGREQAEQLAARLRHQERPPVVYSSPFTRCLQTIGPYGDATGNAPVVDEEIGEVFVGAWEGLSWEEIVSGDEELAARFREQEAMFSLAPGGETGPQLRRRVVARIEAILERHPDGDVLAVTHGGVINAYLGHVLGLDQDMFFLPENASVNTVTVDGRTRRVRFLNDVRHLTEPQLFAPLRRAERASEDAPAHD